MKGSVPVKKYLVYELSGNGSKEEETTRDKTKETAAPG